MLLCRIASPWHGSYSVNRASMMASVPALLDWARDRAAKRAAGIVDLFDNAAGPAPPDLPDWSENERLWGERKSLGCFISGHPAIDLRERHAHRITHGIGQLEDLLDTGTHEDVVVCGLLVQHFHNSFSTNLIIEDETGRAEVSMQRDLVERYRYAMKDDNILLMRLSIYYGKSGGKWDAQKIGIVGAFTLASDPSP